MIVEFEVENPDLPEEKAIVVSGRFDHAKDGRAFGLCCKEWLERGYIVSTWRAGL